VSQVRLGILTGGGDCPGLNAVIRAVVRKGISTYNHTIFGIRNGYQGLVDQQAVPLTLDSVRHPPPGRHHPGDLPGRPTALP
jgi:6-phosphofructokinase